jgi:hypothetical protein
VKNPPDHADSGGLAARSRDPNAQGGTVEELGEKVSAGDDGGTDTTRGLHVGDRLFNSCGGDDDLLGSLDAAAILWMKQHPSRTQKIKSLGISPLIKRPVGTLDPSAPRLNDQGERGHAATPDAAKKVVSKLGHRRNLQLLPVRCNAVGDAAMSKIE